MSGTYGDLPRDDLATVATTTFLAVRERAPDELVTALLEALYGDPALTKEFGLLARRRAADWRMLDLHPAARRYFDAFGTGSKR